MRRTGTTTRMVDDYIQDLFKTGSIEVIDHWDTRKSNVRVMDIIIRRLKHEHPATQLKVSRCNLSIELKQNKDDEKIK